MLQFCSGKYKGVFLKACLGFKLQYNIQNGKAAFSNYLIGNFILSKCEGNVGKTLLVFSSIVDGCRGGGHHISLSLHNYANVFHDKYCAQR